MDKTIEIQISPSAPILLACLLLLLPIQWVGAFLLAVVVHECCHGVMILLCGGTISGIQVRANGVHMQTEHITGFKESVCALAGPLGSLSLLFLARHLPRTAICGIAHCLYNLIPMFPLDGGRIVRGIVFSIFSPPRAEKVFSYIQRAVAILLVFLLVLLISKAGFLALFVGLLFLWKMHLPRSAFGGTIGTITKKRYGYDRVTQKNSSHGSKTGTLHRRGV